MNSRKPSDIELLPSLDIISKIISLGSLNISDIESNIPNPINSKYYYPSDFDKLALHVLSSPSFFSLFYVNLNSLDAHLGDLQTILALMNSPFHVLGISETRENYSSGFKMNNNFDGYILHSQPSRSAAGGVAIYTRHTLNAFKRTDLNTTDDEFETIWVEMVRANVCKYQATGGHGQKLNFAHILFIHTVRLSEAKQRVEAKYIFKVIQFNG